MKKNKPPTLNFVEMPCGMFIKITFPNFATRFPINFSDCGINRFVLKFGQKVQLQKLAGLSACLKLNETLNK